MRKARIANRTDVTDRIAAFDLVPEDGSDWPAHTPGAHIDVDLEGPGTRSYSLIDWPDSDARTWRIAVLREEAGTGGSDAMHALKADDVLFVSDPANDFELRDGDRPVALLAGGIGVTPLISMATALRGQGRRYDFRYAGRNHAAMAWADRLHADLDAALHPDDTDPPDLSAFMRDWSGHDIYVCGPRGMIDAARAAAEEAGHDMDRFHVELFTAAAASGTDKTFQVELASSGEVLDIPPGRSIIEVLEENGHDVMYDCQRGDCGICQTDVMSGTPDHRDVVLSQAERDSGKVMQICVSRALSDKLVLEL